MRSAALFAFIRVVLLALAAHAAEPKPPKPRYVLPGSTGALHVPGLAKARDEGTKLVERVLQVELEAPPWFVVVSSRAPRIEWDAARLYRFDYRIAEDAAPGPFVVTIKKSVEVKRPKRLAGTRRTELAHVPFDVAPIPRIAWAASPLGGSALRACALFLAALLGHVALWRRRAPKRHVPALLGAFGIPAAMYAALSPISGCLLAADLLAYAALAAAYMQSYPAAQAQSPTLLIALALARRPAGMTEEELADAIPREKLVGDRVRDLLDAGLVEPGQTKGRVRLTGRGAALLPPFKALRLILGLPEGKG